MINDGVVEMWFEEEGFSDNCESDPYGVSAPQNILENLKDRFQGTSSLIPLQSAGKRVNRL